MVSDWRMSAIQAGQESELAADAGFQIGRIAGTPIDPEALRGQGGEGLEVGELEAEERNAGRMGT